MKTTLQATGTTDLPWAQLRLPPFSQVALRVLHLAATENVQLHELSDLISSDPGMHEQERELFGKDHCEIGVLLEAASGFWSDHDAASR